MWRREKQKDEAAKNRPGLACEVSAKKKETDTETRLIIRRGPKQKETRRGRQINPSVQETKYMRGKVIRGQIKMEKI